VHALIEVPRLMAEALKLEPQIERAWRRTREGTRPCSISAAAPSFPIALEVRRSQLKEISYIHAEGLCRRRTQARADRADRRHHAGDRDRALRPACSRKTASNMQEVAARGRQDTILVTDPKGRQGSRRSNSTEIIDSPLPDHGLHA